MKRLTIGYITLLATILSISCNQSAPVELAMETTVNNPGGCDLVGPLQFINVHGDNYEYRSHKPIQIAEYVRRIFQDRKGNLWFGTNAYGVCRYDRDTLRYFSNYDGLAGYQVTGILEDQKGNMWFSTNGGVSMYDGNIFTNYTEKNGLSSNSVWSIFEDSHGTIWAGTVKGLCKLNPTEETTFTGFAIPKADVADTMPRFSTSLVSSIMEDKSGNLYFGTDGAGVCKYDGTSFSHLTTKDGLCGNNVVSMLQDKNGDLWFSSHFGGLSKYDGQSFTTFNVKNGAIGDDEVWTMHEDRAGNIWFSSEGFGVYRFDGERITNFGIDEGLPIRAVQSIFEDKQGLMWIGGGNGLYQFYENRFTQVTRKGPWGGC